ncbi:sulfotransferase domain-containing protein [Thalassotalea euphylliae]|uniref:sulfotransferase domain-containing protein n=1 Tax=Thalassotalea euphylliae TaxID=1655234 RepID=UPI00362C8418
MNEQANKPSPDFVICGAMKCGTTSLHHMLDSHPNVLIPAKEVHYYNECDIVQHPDFSTFHDGVWRGRRSLANNSTLDKVVEGNLYGEDSTTYLASEVAIRSLSKLSKKPKLIVMLRQPSKRAYSQYWHLVNSGRVSQSFEKVIMNNPLLLLDRSMYKRQLDVIYKYFEPSEVLIVVFENFVVKPEEELDRVAKFLNIDVSLFPANIIRTHSNASSRYLSTSLLFIKNKLLREHAFIKYQDKSLLPKKYKYLRYYNALIERLHNLVNPRVNSSLPPMKNNTKKYLDDYFKKEFEGINSVLDIDVTSIWFK